MYGLCGRIVLLLCRATNVCVDYKLCFEVSPVCVLEKTMDKVVQN